MTLTSHSANSGHLTTVSSLDVTAKKILQTCCRVNEPMQLEEINDIHISEPLTGDAQELKELLIASSSYKQHLRFSFSKLRRVVVPPVQIPFELATARAIGSIVAGVRIPMTKAMWTWHRARLMQRLPRRVDERVAW
uniref:Uncharacterized protein n=1 Tax=Hyaloperonospora arabidopsidis (strain Emoy2) TaxID=559515 RepID=M4BVT6_HYAAE